MKCNACDHPIKKHGIHGCTVGSCPCQIESPQAQIKWAKKLKERADAAPTVHQFYRKWP